MRDDDGDGGGGACTVLTAALLSNSSSFILPSKVIYADTLRALTAECSGVGYMFERSGRASGTGSDVVDGRLVQVPT